MPSTVIRWFCYHPAEQRLEILFITGRQYSYHSVPAEMVDAARRAFSKDEFFNIHIRDRFRCTRETSGTPAGTHSDI